MDISLTSNKDSTLLNTLWQSDISNPFKYKILTNFPNGSRTFTRVYPLAGSTQTTPTSSQVEIQYQIPKVMLLQDMVHKITITTSAAGTEGGNVIKDGGEIGMFIFSSQRLTARGKTICQTDPYHTQVRARLANFSESTGISKLTNAVWNSNLSTVTGAPASTPLTFMAPFYNTFSEKTCMFLDTQWLEQLQLNCIVESTTNLNCERTIASATFELYCFFRCLDTETITAVRASNFDPARISSWLFTDSYTEATQAITNGNTSTSITLKNKYVASSTSFFPITTYASSTAGGAFKKALSSGTAGIITSFDFQASGFYIFSGVPVGVLQYDEMRRYGKSNMTCTSSGTLANVGTPFDIKTIYWSELADRSCNSMALAYYSLGQPILTVYHTDPGATTFSLIVTHEVLSFINFDPTNGSIEIMRSS